MSYSSARARRRPRVHSCSWRTFAWLLRREAALRVVTGEWGTLLHDEPLRRAFLALTWREIRLMVAVTLRHFPDRGHAR